MNADADLERRLAGYYATEAPQRAPDQVLESVLDTTESTRQRRPLFGAPWRFPIMNAYAKVAVAAVLVVAVGVVGLAVLRPDTSSGVGGQPTASPSLLPPPSASPSDSRAASPALTETFTSERFGFSISHPAGWVTRPATEPWTSGFPNFESTAGDVIYDPTRDAGHLWIMVASQPQAGKSGEQWVDEQLTGLSSAGICEAPREAVVIDGAQGGICSSAVTVVSAGDRGYIILLYVSGDDPADAGTYDQDWFEQLIATVQIRPEEAVDVAPSASP
jgi:hypothetical protein